MIWDQQEIRQRLLSVYSGNLLHDINDDLIAATFDPEGKLGNTQKTMEALTRDPVYLSVIGELKLLKKEIEDTFALENPLNTEAEVRTILFDVVLNKSISYSKLDPGTYSYKMRLLYDLIREQFIGTDRWSTRLKVHFEFVYNIIKDWYSFFFSYTNKRALDINRRFETILKLNPVSEKANQVANFIVEKLIEAPLSNVFMDNRKIEDGDNLKETIDEAIRRSHTFVQLVSQETFSMAGTNWCLYEFQQYKDFQQTISMKYPFYYQNALRDNCFFFVAGSDLDKVKPSYLISDYRPWFAEMKAVLYRTPFSVAPGDVSQPGANAFTVFEDNVNRLAEAIIQAKKRLIDSIPPTVPGEAA